MSKRVAHTRLYIQNIKLKCILEFIQKMYFIVDEIEDDLRSTWLNPTNTKEKNIFFILIVITFLMSHSLFFISIYVGKPAFWSITVSDNKLSAVFKFFKTIILWYFLSSQFKYLNDLSISTILYWGKLRRIKLKKNFKILVCL